MKKLYIIEKLEDAISSATMENACFDWTGKPDHNRLMKIRSDEELTDYIRKKVKLHHQTWVIGPIKEALAVIKEVE